MPEFDNNSFEHDYILKILANFEVDLQTAKSRRQLLDSYACQLTAFMMGQVAVEIRRRGYDE